MHVVTDRLAAILVVGVLAAPVHGQSRASLVTDPGSTVGVTVDLGMSTDLYGPLAGSAADSASASGTALITVFPTDPQFTHAILHSIHLDVGATDVRYDFLGGMVRVDLTLTDLVLHSTGPALGTINANGDASFPQASQHMTGSVHIFSSALGIAHTMELDDSDVAPLDAQITDAAGTVLLTRLLFCSFQDQADPGELPPGVNSLVIDVSVDAANVHLRGPHNPALPGDWDADGDLDLSDFASLHDCLAGPDVLVEVFCTLFDFDDDGDVDMRDVAAFAEDFTGPL